MSIALSGFDGFWFNVATYATLAAGLIGLAVLALSAAQLASIVRTALPQQSESA